MSKPTLNCNMPGCGLRCEHLSMVAEEILVLTGEDSNTERLFPGRVARNHRVRCPVHGIRIVQRFGNHVSVEKRAKKSSEHRRKNRRQR
jgi:hypothetical protein